MLDQLGLPSKIERTSIVLEYPYFRTAFIFPPWQEIYTTDAERDQTYTDAVAVHEGTIHWYRRCGYDLAEVPCGTVQERCDFILERLT